MITQDNFIEREQDIADHPSAKHFDWRELSAICVSPVPEHPAYGMPFDKYAEYRKDNTDYDETEKARLTFRIPPIIAYGLPIIADKHDVSTHRYLSLLVEMGLITFQKDYYDRYNIILKHNTDIFYTDMESTSLLRAVLQVQKQTISLGSSARENKKFMPTVPSWLADTVRSTALRINMTMSDMVFVCICKGLSNDLKDVQMPRGYVEQVSTTLDLFDFELQNLEEKVEHIYRKFNRK